MQFGFKFLLKYVLKTLQSVQVRLPFASPVRAFNIFREKNRFANRIEMDNLCTETVFVSIEEPKVLSVRNHRIKNTTTSLHLIQKLFLIRIYHSRFAA